VSPSEAEWVKWVENEMQGGIADQSGKANVGLENVSVEDVLKNGYGGNANEYEDRATDVQMAFERWVLRSKEVGGFYYCSYWLHTNMHSLVEL
jgi:ATP-dependent RNA helicase DDX31/DBP7